MKFEDVSCRKAKGKAILVEIPDLGGEFWIPQSQVTDDSEVWKEGDTGTLVISDWFAEKNGW